MKSYWRSQAEPLIAQVLRQTQGQSEAQIKQALAKAYPFDWRGEYSREAWRAEIRAQWHREPKPVESSRSLFEEEQ